MLDLLLRRDELCQRVTHQVYAIFRRAAKSPRPALRRLPLQRSAELFPPALVLMGALPNVPGLMIVETYMRQYAHERAYIPDAARATAERIATADFDFTSRPLHGGM
jgi:hypothetical protein